MNKTQIMKHRLGALEKMGHQDLEEKFRELFGRDAPKSNVRNLRMRLGWKVQEILFGGLDSEDVEKLKELADNDPLANLSMKKSRIAKVLRGTRYEKIWNGKKYQVTVGKNGQFEFNGKFYRSLSVVASEITGTHWNGRKFFGVK